MKPAPRLARWIDRLRRRLIPDPVVVPPAVYSDLAFVNTTVELSGGDQFLRCKFEGCRLILDGTGFGLHHCTISGCMFDFQGQALNVLKFLSSTYASAGCGDAVVEKVFDAIRQGWYR